MNAVNIEEKLQFDTKSRLGPDGQPLHAGNDYERHLYARKLREEGKSRTDVLLSLYELGLDDISESKRGQYVQDVLDSILVGFSDNPLPIYGITKEEK